MTHISCSKTTDFSHGHTEIGYLVVPSSATSTCQHNEPVPVATYHQSHFHITANFTSSHFPFFYFFFFFHSQIRGCCFVVIGSFSSYLLFTFSFLPLSLSYISLLLLFANIGWVWSYFLKVACSPQIPGHNGRCLGSRGGVGKEVHWCHSPELC